ncbi:hypothetical protein ELG88_28920 (plasmid) [Rhizobium leguminosarum]|nr:hypothetical protein ELG88_28920 [Rhizobium leguminosarum]TBG01233.1 hypothetical protein ELG85_21950 [Rhizobium leguminosarum]TBG55777.1 hypothetical protein ELG74_31030 [Rhizobium leguminosarum]
MLSFRRMPSDWYGSWDQAIAAGYTRGLSTMSRPWAINYIDRRRPIFEGLGGSPPSRTSGIGYRGSHRVGRLFKPDSRPNLLSVKRGKVPPTHRKDHTVVNLVERYKPLGIMAVRAATEIKPQEPTQHDRRTSAEQQVPNLLLDHFQGSD